MRISVLRNEKGFTILEAVFAASILAFAILSYTMLKTSSRHSQVFAKQLAQAIQLSDSQMDDFVRRNLNNPNDLLLTATAGTAYHQDAALLATLQVGDFALGDATWTVKDRCPSELSKLITFTAKWNMDANPPKEFTTTRVLVRP